MKIVLKQVNLKREKKNGEGLQPLCRLGCESDCTRVN